MGINKRFFRFLIRCEKLQDRGWQKRAIHSGHLRWSILTPCGVQILTEILALELAATGDVLGLVLVISVSSLPGSFHFLFPLSPNKQL